jgi:hypothetical protein
MTNPWKWIALGFMALTGVVATSTLTTAYLMRPPAAVATTAPTEPVAERRAPIVRVAPSALSRAASIPGPRVSRAAAIVPSAASTPIAADAAASLEPSASTAVTPRPNVAPSSALPDVPATGAKVTARPAAVSAPADCETGGDRALRIAKPGALGALLGAGLGAAGGAIADGGKAAGKGALIGGIAGAALGTGYGAYKTKNECGAIFGSSTPSRSVGTAAPAPADLATVGTTPREETMAPLRAPAADPGRIQVYGVR